MLEEKQQGDDMSTHPPHKNYCTHFVGLDVEVPLLDGAHRRYINFDNAASTPSLKDVREVVNRFLNYYSSVHRGTGFKSQLSTHSYEQARQIVMEFVGADPDTHTCIFGKNASEALNKLARRFPFTSERNMVLCSGMEHHSNDLPWRMAAKTVHINILPDGCLDLVDFDAKLSEYGKRLALVAITGASNVTGHINPVHSLAEKVHAAGAQIVVDIAQLAAHRKVDMLPLDDPAHLDYVALSAHKMYAPYGTGALIGRRDTFESGDPDQVGGGTVEIVTLENVTWAGPPDRDEVGSPNVVGAIALGAAIRTLSEIGMETVAQHETKLTAHLITRLQEIPKIKVYGDANPKHASKRLGVVPFNIEGLSHFHLAAILGHEYGIGVRNGCFCAHPYLLRLLDINQENSEAVRGRMLKGDRSDMPGLVRISFGLYNLVEEIDTLIDALKDITAGKYQGTYTQDMATGEYYPLNWQPNFEDYFSL